MNLLAAFPSLILIALASLITVYGLLRWQTRHRRPTAFTGSIMLWCGALWLLANGLEMASTDLATATTWYKLEYLAMLPIPVLWMYLARQFTNTTAILTRRRLLLLTVLPIVCSIVVLTNETHGYFVSDLQLERDGTIAHIMIKPGPFFAIFYIYSYIVALSGTFVITRRLLHTPGFRWQGTMVLVAVLATVFASILDWSGLSPVPQLRLAPFTLVMSIPIFVLTIVRLRRADLLPIARTQTIQFLPDAVLMVDLEDRILDLNPAAEAMLGRSLKEVLGETIEASWPGWTDQISAETAIVTRPDADGNVRQFDVRQSPVRDWRGQLVSHIFVLRDVTERLRAETALHMSEEYFRALTERSTDFVIIISADVQIRYTSPSVGRMFGYQIETLTNRDALEFIHPEDRERVVEQFTHAVQQPGVAPPTTIRVADSAGHWHKIECVANNLLDHPAIRGIVVNARDVTERSEIEDKLRLSEEYFRALIEKSTDITIITDMFGTIQYVSPSLERVFKRTREQVIGHSTLEFLHLDDVTDLLTTMTQGLREGAPIKVSTARFHDSEGQYHVLEFTATNLLEYPAVKGVIVNAREVTEREQIAQALRQSEEIYRLHFTNLNDVVYSYDANRIITSISPSVERILGYPPEPFIGQSLELITALPLLRPGYGEKALEEAARVLSGERIEGTLYEFLALDGSVITAEISSSPILREGQVIGSVNVARNITERIQSETRLRTSLQEKEVLLKEIHHRVKNNMQIIASLLNLQSGTIADPATRVQFEDSQNRIRSMALVHERLYRSSELSHIDFEAYLRDLTGHLVQGYHGRSHGVELEIRAENIQLDVDTAIPCGLIVNELISNAFKHAFTGAAGGLIRIDVTRGDHGWYHLRVADNGVGLPPEIDFRESKTLGLQLVSSLTKQLKGTLELHRANGTVVSITFPSSEDALLPNETRPT
ncbi:MAG: PAS domain S-box protein [Anaerolineae bacterium]|nr:PAS domain S-box protein [Anaerolineae bacterium]